MPTYVLREAEKQRINKLRQYEILDTPTGKHYDDLTRLASEICQTPICLISLIDDNRLSIKSTEGTHSPEIPEESSFYCRVNFQNRSAEKFSPFQITALETLTRQVEQLIEHHRLSQLLAEQTKEASLGRMACEISHEIKNPLTTIRLQSQHLRVCHGKSQFSELQMIKGLLKIEACVHHIVKTVSSIEKFARHSSWDEMSVESTFKIIEDTLSICHKKFEGDDIKFNLSAAPSINIKCRPSEVTQVLLNLLDNAYDAVIPMQDKWIQITVKVENRKKQSWVLISIEDSGKRIPKAVAEKLMHPFFTTKPTKKGTGLGLSITKRIIESHGGRFYYDPKCSNTRFVVEFPEYQG